MSPSGTSPASDRNVAAPYAAARGEALPAPPKRSPSRCRRSEAPALPPKRSSKERGHSCPRSARPPSDRNVAAPYAAARGEAAHAPPKRSGKERGHSCPRRARPPSATGMSLLLMLSPEAKPLTLPAEAKPPHSRRSEAVRSGDILVPGTAKPCLPRNASVGNVSMLQMSPDIELGLVPAR